MGFFLSSVRTPQRLLSAICTVKGDRMPSLAWWGCNTSVLYLAAAKREEKRQQGSTPTTSKGKLFLCPRSVCRRKDKEASAVLLHAGREQAALAHCACRFLASWGSALVLAPSGRSGRVSSTPLFTIPLHTSRARKSRAPAESQAPFRLPCQQSLELPPAPCFACQPRARSALFHPCLPPRAPSELRAAGT